MKKLFFSICLGIGLSASASEVWTTSVGSNLVTVAPGATRITKRVPLGVVTNGYTYANAGKIYFVVQTGTVTALPTHSGESAASGTTLRAYEFGNNSWIKSRKVIYLENTGVHDVYVADTKITAGKGIKLEPGDQVFLSLTGPIRAITASGITTLSGWEVVE